MKVTREKTEDCQAFLTVELEPAEMEDALAEGYRHLAEEVKVPGFRKGKTPRKVLERYLGREAALEEALQHVLPESYQKALQEQEIAPIARPAIEVTQKEPVIIFKAVVPLPPQVEVGDYQQIAVAPEEATVAEGDIDSVVAELRRQHATWEPVTRPVALNDLVVLDIASTIEEKPFLNRQAVQYPVLPNAVAPLPGFAEQLMGMSGGEEKEFRLTVPENFRQKELAGKEATFQVKVIDVKEEKLPELDDTFARQVDPEFADVGAMREKVNTGLQERAEARTRTDFENRIIEAVVEIAKVEFPPVMVEEEINQLLEEQVRRMQMDAKGFAQYMKAINKTEEQLREELRPIAAKRVTGSLVLGKITEMEKTEVSEPDIDAEIEVMTGGAPETEKERLKELLNQAGSRESLRRILMTRKTMARLAEIARGNAEKQKKGKEEKK